MTGSAHRPDPGWIRRMSPPEDEIPVALPHNTVLARTDDVAVALLGLQVYSLGVAFDLVVRLRRAGRRPSGSRPLPDVPPDSWFVR